MITKPPDVVSLLEKLRDSEEDLDDQLLHAANWKSQLELVEATCRVLNGLRQRLKQKALYEKLSFAQNMTGGQRPSSVNWLDQIELVESTCDELNSLLFRLKKKKCLLEFGEKDDDIYVATFPRSGTTCVQMILYQLTTDGHMDFEHIDDVSPWIHWAVLKNKPIKPVSSPRIIKTHDSYDEMSRVKKGRFIFVIRNGFDVINSLYYHFKSYRDSNLSFDDVFKMKIKGWFSYVSDWIEDRSGIQILYLRYEDLLQDIEREVKKIVAFCELDVGAGKIRTAIERSRFDFLKRHQAKFGEQPEHHKIYDQFIRRGKAGQGIQRASREQLKEYQELFNTYFGKSAIMKPYQR